MTGQDDEQALSGHRSYSIEGTADAHEQRLLMITQSVHIETIGSNIMGSRGEGHQPEGG